MDVISVAMTPGCSLWSQVAKRRASWVYKAMVLADRSGRWASFSCQAAISCHMTPPCYRHSYIIGTVFHEIAPATLPIIYHNEEGTVPISLLCGTVLCECSERACFRFPLFPGLADRGDQHLDRSTLGDKCRCSCRVGACSRRTIVMDTQH